MKTPGTEVSSMLEQEEAKQSTLSSNPPHRERQQWKGCFNQTENKKSTDCASSQIGGLNNRHIIQLLIQSVVHMHTKHRQKWTTGVHAPTKQTSMLSANVCYPTCQCTEEVMELPSCFVTTKPVKTFLTGTGRWRLGSQRRGYKKPELLLTSKLLFSQDSDSQPP